VGLYALRITNFTRQFGGAEVDMHFSLSKDLVKLSDFLAVLRDDEQGKGYHHAGARHLLTETAGYSGIAVWRREGQTLTSRRQA
jgi:hypothetical protein